MSELVIKKCKVLDAVYVDDTDSILILGETDLDDGKKGRLHHQIHSSCFTFGNKNKVAEMKKTAELMKGKIINMAFDTNLPDKIQDGEKLAYG